MRLPIVVGAVAGLIFAGTMYATRSFVEPTMQERPVVERRLTCPDGYKLYELYPKNAAGNFLASGSTFMTWSGTSIVYNGSSYISMEDDKGEVWQQGKAPKLSEHVCVSKPSKKTAPATNVDAPKEDDK